MTRTEIIQSLIDMINAKSYLEIGVSFGDNFRSIKCKNKIGVDPDSGSAATLCITSDEFFKQNTQKFDVIFIDGLHHDDQVYLDIINSLNCLNDNGYIVCHDMNPLTKERQLIPSNGGMWNGNCWEAFVRLRQERNDLEMYVINTDHGCGVIKKGRQNPLKIDCEINYENFDKNRKEWLNLIEVPEFLEKLSCSFRMLLHNYILNPDDPEVNFSLALHYENIGQTASALSYYLRCAERTFDDLLKYECLIRSSMCFDKQGTRGFTVKGLLQHAISVLPKRPEAYYLLARFFERDTRDGHWNDSYMISSIGEKVCSFEGEPLRTKVDYPGKYGLFFQKAVSSWWCGLCEESRELFTELYEKYELDDNHRKSVIENLIKLNGLKENSEEKFSVYKKEKYPLIKNKFFNLDIIEQNYSESYQDMFVLTMLNGKHKGTYLEIGAGNSFYGNNTALLEQKFDWEGVALDIDENFVSAHRKERLNPCLLKDATCTNYSILLSGLEFPTNIDYLQIDCDPPSVTYDILLTIPFEKYKFAVITYEHDYYCDETKSFQEKSKKYLENYGYVRVVNNISPDGIRSYEDWWVHPDLVNENILKEMMCIDDRIKKAEDYLFGKL